jgi:two-component system nitrate/nitrite response regulator NarL
MKVLVVDDHPLVRRGIVSTISFENDIEDITEASNISEAMSNLINNKPDITVIDLYLGTEDGLEIVNQAKAKNINSKFIVLTSSSKKSDFAKAQKLDVEGYILKDAFAEDFIYAFKVVNRGKKYYDPAVIEYKYGNGEKSNLDELTERELDVLKELSLGHSNGQIAKTLFISENTVKKHVSAILNKLDLSHRTEAALFAMKMSC